jgi:hypothetical protein
MQRGRSASEAGGPAPPSRRHLDPGDAGGNPPRRWPSIYIDQLYGHRDAGPSGPSGVDPASGGPGARAPIERPGTSAPGTCRCPAGAGDGLGRWGRRRPFWPPGLATPSPSWRSPALRRGPAPPGEAQPLPARDLSVPAQPGLAAAWLAPNAGPGGGGVVKSGGRRRWLWRGGAHLPRRRRSVDHPHERQSRGAGVPARAVLFAGGSDRSSSRSAPCEWPGQGAVYRRRHLALVGSS